ncbi:hypothetical protein QBC46DRAFT_399590 [Diplogelasinospora grovesii]|uniref:Rhodopsin domain-containing protein n=1 Tax=Diplogelasinospora grovesii TaxID=303347 RepID=A0AAN6MWR8_9PEZI|nr:hypothetical protein QBC46DRAFT_399590 [Diplogelasinospora grovesii]
MEVLLSRAAAATDDVDESNLPPYAHDSIVRSLITYVGLLLCVNLVVVSLRFYIRLRLIRKFGYDDWALAATLFATIGAAGGTTSGTAFGLGRHIWVLSIQEQSSSMLLIFIGALGYHCTIMVIKSAFLLQYRRVFPLPHFQRLCDIFLGFIACWFVAGSIAAVFICWPIEMNWDPTGPPWKYCENRYRLWLGHGVMHLITDVAILSMPLPLLKTLPLLPLHKFVLMGVFCLGFLTCAISAYRITTLRASLMGEDATWTSATTVFWSLGEVTCATICLCIPTLRPLMPKLKCLEIRMRRRGDVERGPSGASNSWRIRGRRFVLPRILSTTQLLDSGSTDTTLSKSGNLAADRRGEVWDGELEPQRPRPPDRGEDGDEDRGAETDSTSNRPPGTASTNHAPDTPVRSMNGRELHPQDSLHGLHGRAQDSGI